MVCFIKYKPLEKWSFKNAAYLVIFVFICVFLHMWALRDLINFVDKVTTMMKKAEQQRLEISRVRDDNMKYILLWDDNSSIPISPLSKHICSVTNCIFSKNRGLLSGDYSRYDGILFNQMYLDQATESPIQRTASQIYIFSSLESSANYPACELFNDDFFNWTFTYRLDSDVVWNFFTVRNFSGNILAPSETVRWNTTVNPIANKIRSVFQGRTRAAAWIVSHCAADSLRDEYLTSLQEHLFHYSLQIDVYGKCTKRACDNDDCHEMLRKNYYFYMAFENSFSRDYITEKVLHGYNNYVVPIVYSGANYTRFLPPGSYIDARKFHPFNLAYLINQAVKHVEIYETFFQWSNYYTIESNSPRHSLCKLCKAMNSNKTRYAPAKKKFRLWWNTLKGMKWCLSKEFWNETAKINTDANHVYKNTYS